MRRLFVLVVPAVLLVIALSTCDLFSVPSTEFESDSTIGTLQISIPWIAPWVTDALDGSRAYLRASAVSAELYNSSNVLIASDTLSVTDPEVEDPEPATATWTVPNGTGYRLEVRIYNTAVSNTNPVLTGTATGINVNGGTTNVTLTCLPVTPTPLTEDLVSAGDLAATGEKWFTAAATGSDTYFYCDTSAANGYTGSADIWVFDNSGIYQKYAVGQDTDVVHFDTTLGQEFYVGVYASAAGTFGVKFASTTMDLTVALDEVAPVTYDAGVLTVKYTVTNNSLADDAGPFRVAISDGKGSSTVVDYSGLDAGATTALQTVAFATAATNGTLTATVDSQSAVDESNETNNTDSSDWTAGTGTIIITIQ